MNIEITTDPKRLDQSWIITQIQASYWGAKYTPQQIVQAAHNSVCFGAYADGKQVGYARVVSDHNIFSSLTDMIVQEDVRGKGVGTSLLKAVCRHPAVANTICVLRARQGAWLWYFRHGDFHVFDKAHGFMQRMPR